jgi:hypothetical protein
VSVKPRKRKGVRKGELALFDNPPGYKQAVLDVSAALLERLAVIAGRRDDAAAIGAIRDRLQEIHNYSHAGRYIVAAETPEAMQRQRIGEFLPWLRDVLGQFERLDFTTKAAICRQYTDDGGQLDAEARRTAFAADVAAMRRLVRVSDEALRVLNPRPGPVGDMIDEICYQLAELYESIAGQPFTYGRLSVVPLPEAFNSSKGTRFVYRAGKFLRPEVRDSRFASAMRKISQRRDALAKLASD